jgi:hypothetical protein
MDGIPLELEDGAVMVPLATDGVTRQVRVALGADVGPRYAPFRDLVAGA